MNISSVKCIGLLMTIVIFIGNQSQKGHSTVHLLKSLPDVLRF